MQEDELLALRDTPEEALSGIYQRYRAGFLVYIRKFGGQNADHLDAYHDAVLGFYNVYREGRYQAERASVKTLLYTIGKYRLLTRLGKQSKEPVWEDIGVASDLRMPVEQHDSERLIKTKRAMAEIGESCRQIIQLFYYQRLSIREITQRLDYKNENVVKAHKSRCMRKLRELVTGN